MRRVEALEREASEAATRIRRGGAATRAERGELSLTRLDYLQAAAHFRAAADLLRREDSELRLDYLERSASALKAHGDEKGDNASLRMAIDAYKNCAGTQTRAGAAGLGDDPEQPGQRASSAGTAGGQNGPTGGGGGHLSGDPAERTRERVPLDWATTQNNLGNALQMLGWQEGGTARLEEAVTAYREALTELTRERAPLGWAVTQNNLGDALCTLGDRESRNGPS